MQSQHSDIQTQTKITQEWVWPKSQPCPASSANQHKYWSSQASNYRVRLAYKLAMYNAMHNTQLTT